MRKIIISLAVLALSGCATWGQMEDGLASLQGKPLNVAVNTLGYPSGERTIAGRRLVVWSNQSRGVMFVPQTATTYGNVNALGAAGTYNQTTSYSSAVPLDYQCEIVLEVGTNDIIQGYQYQGNLGGCNNYINSLRRLAK